MFTLQLLAALFFLLLDLLLLPNCVVNRCGMGLNTAHKHKIQ